MNTTRDRRRDAVTKKILDEARKIILRQGLDGLSMRALAQAIDYSPAAIYKYFSKKQDILQAIRDEYWELVFARRAELSLENCEPPERLFKVAMAYKETATTYPEHYLLMFNSKEAPFTAVSDLGSDRRLSGLVGLIKDGVEKAYFTLPSDYTPETMALQFWVSMHGIIMLRMTVMEGSQEEFDRLSEGLIRCSIDAICKGKR